MKIATTRRLFAPFCAVALFFAAGCASVSVCDKGADMVSIQNSGCFLFYCIPLFTGDPDYPNQQVCNWFENTVKLGTNVRLLDEVATERGAIGYRNVVSHRDDEPILFLLLKRKVYRTSAELVRAGAQL